MNGVGVVDPVCIVRSTSEEFHDVTLLGDTALVTYAVNRTINR